MPELPIAKLILNGKTYLGAGGIGAEFKTPDGGRGHLGDFRASYSDFGVGLTDTNGNPMSRDQRETEVRKTAKHGMTGEFEGDYLEHSVRVPIHVDATHTNKFDDTEHVVRFS